MIEYKSFTDFPRGTMYAILKDAYSYDGRNKEVWDDNWKESDDFFMIIQKSPGNMAWLLVLMGKNHRANQESRAEFR